MPDNFKAGQYLALRIPKSAFNGKYDHDCTRNYSVSCAPGKGYLRCSIGRNIDDDYHGIVSGYMHDHVKEGHNVLVRT